MTAKRSGSTSDAGREPGPALALLDTNALFLPLSSAIRLDEAVARAIGPSRIVVPSGVLGELARLQARGVPGAVAALALASRYPIARTVRRGDAGVAELARRLGAWVVTGDRELRSELRRSGVGVLSPRGRQGLRLWPALAPQTVKNARPLQAARTYRRGNHDRRRPAARRSRPRVRKRGDRGL